MIKTYKNEVKVADHCARALYKGLGAAYTPSEVKEVERQVYKDGFDKWRKTSDGQKYAKVPYKIAQQRFDEVDKTMHFTNADRVGEILKSRGKAGDQKIMRFSDKQNTWVPSVENTITEMYRSYPGQHLGILSPSGAYHSVLLRVDNSNPDAPKVFWYDQNKNSHNATGKLEKALKLFKPKNGQYADTTYWPLIPSADAR